MWIRLRITTGCGDLSRVPRRYGRGAREKCSSEARTSGSTRASTVYNPAFPHFAYATCWSNSRSNTASSSAERGTVTCCCVAYVRKASAASGGNAGAFAKASSEAKVAALADT